MRSRIFVSSQATAPAVRWTSSSRAAPGSMSRGNPNVTTAARAAASASRRAAAARARFVDDPWNRHVFPPGIAHILHATPVDFDLAVHIVRSMRVPLTGNLHADPG